MTKKIILIKVHCPRCSKLLGEFIENSIVWCKCGQKIDLSKKDKK